MPKEEISHYKPKNKLQKQQLQSLLKRKCTGEKCQGSAILAKNGFTQLFRDTSKFKGSSLQMTNKNLKKDANIFKFQHFKMY